VRLDILGDNLVDGLRSRDGRARKPGRQNRNENSNHFRKLLCL
jgi:hypothetical protein